MDKSEFDHSERRRAIRETNIKLPEGELTLMFDDRPVQIYEFKDITPFGVCLQAAEPASPSSAITIRYLHRHGQFEVFGEMVWQEPVLASVNDQKHWIGIQFTPDRITQNEALFELLLVH